MACYQPALRVQAGEERTRPAAAQLDQSVTSHLLSAQLPIEDVATNGVREQAQPVTPGSTAPKQRDQLARRAQVPDKYVARIGIAVERAHHRRWDGWLSVGCGE